MTDHSFRSQFGASSQPGRPPTEPQLPYSILGGVLLERPASMTRQAAWTAAAAQPTKHRAAHTLLSFGELIASAVPFLVVFLMIAGFGMVARPLLAEGLPIFATQSGPVRQAAYKPMIPYPPVITARQS